MAVYISVYICRKIADIRRLQPIVGLKVGFRFLRFFQSDIIFGGLENYPNREGYKSTRRCCCKTRISTDPPGACCRGCTHAPSMSSVDLLSEGVTVNFSSLRMLPSLLAAMILCSPLRHGCQALSYQSYGTEGQGSDKSFLSQLYMLQECRPPRCKSAFS